MQNLTLRHIHYTQLDPTTWCATAQVSSQLTLRLWAKPRQPLAPNIFCSHPIELHAFYWRRCSFQTPLSAIKNAAKKRQQQRNGVRLLLQGLLSKLSIIDTLDDCQFPYRLESSRYYVCFSHSGNSRLNDKVAVVISHRRTVGIDIETQDVAWHVAQRFYHPSEIAILAELPIEQRVIISRYLWQLKESFIKIYHYKLAQGLGMDYTSFIPALMDSFDRDNRLPVIINDSKTGYQIAILPFQQTVVVF
jgi:4'-phosphopantetheinyl transferase